MPNACTPQTRDNWTFSTRLVTHTTLSPESIALGKLNGDAHLDLVIANAQTKNISVRLGNGDSTFGASVNYAGVGTDPRDIAIADFNKDGKNDIVVTNADRSDITVFLATAAGYQASTYTSGPLYTDPKKNPDRAVQPFAVATGDFNKDGYADIAVANATTASISVFTNNRAGQFPLIFDASTGKATNPLDIPVRYFSNGMPDYSVGPSSISAQDFNRDGSLDLLTSNGDLSVSVFYNYGTGITDDHPFTQTNIVAWALTANDLDNDGVPDFFGAGRNAGTPWWGRTEDPFLKGSTYYWPWPVQLSNTDVNGDCYADILSTAGDSLLVNVNKKNRAFDSLGVPFRIAGAGLTNNLTDIALGDVNEDGKPDVIVPNATMNNLTVFLNTETDPNQCFARCLLSTLSCCDGAHQYVCPSGQTPGCRNQIGYPILPGCWDTAGNFTENGGSCQPAGGMLRMWHGSLPGSMWSFLGDFFHTVTAYLTAMLPAR